MPSSHDFKKDKRNNSIKININGKLFLRKNAKISVFDSGFILGDGCWDSIRLHNNKFQKINKIRITCFVKNTNN